MVPVLEASKKEPKSFFILKNKSTFLTTRIYASILHASVPPSISTLFLSSTSLTSHPTHLRHPLLKEGVPPCLTDDEISPLDDHNAGEEGCVAGKFHNLSLFIGLPG